MQLQQPAWPQAAVLRGRLARQVKIMKEWDPSGKQGPKIPLPDVVTVHTPKEEEAPIREDKTKEGLQVRIPFCLCIWCSGGCVPVVYVLSGVLGKSQ